MNRFSYCAAFVTPPSSNSSQAAANSDLAGAPDSLQAPSIPKVNRSKSVTFASDVVFNGSLPGDNFGRKSSSSSCTSSDPSLLNSLQSQIQSISSTLAGLAANFVKGPPLSQVQSGAAIVSSADNLKILDTLTSVTSSLSQQVKESRSSLAAPVKRLTNALDCGNKFRFVRASDAIFPDSKQVHDPRAHPEWPLSWDGVSDDFAVDLDEPPSSPSKPFKVSKVSPLAPTIQLCGDRIAHKILQVVTAGIDVNTRGNSSLEDDKLTATMLKLISEHPLKFLQAIGAEATPAIVAGLRPEHLNLFIQIQNSFKIPAKASERRIQEWNAVSNSNVFGSINRFFHEAELRSFFRGLLSPELRWSSGTPAFTETTNIINYKVMHWVHLASLASAPNI